MYMAASRAVLTNVPDHRGGLPRRLPPPDPGPEARKGQVSPAVTSASPPFSAAAARYVSGRAQRGRQDNSNKRPSMSRCAPGRAIVVASGRLVLSIRSSDLVMTCMTRVCAAAAGETGPARRRENAHTAGHDGTLVPPTAYRTEPRRASQEKRKAPATGGQLTTTAYVPVQDLRPKVWQPESKTLDLSPLMRTTPWALR